MLETSDTPTLEGQFPSPAPVVVPAEQTITRQRINGTLTQGDDYVRERSNGVQLHTSEQARTAALTMVPHLYGIKDVYAGLNAQREGDVWIVPVVWAPVTDKTIMPADELVGEFARAPIVGELRISAINAELTRWSGRNDVRDAVTRLAPPNTRVKVSPPGLSIPVAHHEVAWRHVMWSFQLHKFPPELVAGKAVLDEDEEVWLMPVSMCGDDGEKIWQSTVKVDMHSGHVFDLPSPGELSMALNQ